MELLNGKKQELEELTLLLTNTQQENEDLVQEVTQLQYSREEEQKVLPLASIIISLI